MLKRVIQIFVTMLLGFSLCACMHIKTPKENLQDLTNGKVAAIVSGCKIKDKEHKEGKEFDTERKCTVFWVQRPSKIIAYSGMGIEFIAPGDYEMSGFAEYTENGTKIYIHQREEGRLNTFSAKGGEVLYIGDIEIDMIKREVKVQSVTGQHSEEIVKRILASKYPSLADKLQIRVMNLAKHTSDN